MLVIGVQENKRRLGVKTFGSWGPPTAGSTVDLEQLELKVECLASIYWYSMYQLVELEGTSY
jgi:hypothetical protein